MFDSEPDQRAHTAPLPLGVRTQPVRDRDRKPAELYSFPGRMRGSAPHPGAHLQELTFSQRLPHATAAPWPRFGELPECLARVLMALSATSERLVRLIDLRAQLRDGAAQGFELGALLIAQLDAPIPSLISLSHQPVFAGSRRAPPPLAPASVQACLRACPSERWPA